MSLRAFHLFFIFVTMLLAFGLAWFEYTVFRQGRATVDLVICVAEFLVGAGFIAYAISFRRKTRNL